MADDGDDLDLSAADVSSSLRPAAAPSRFRPKLKGKLVKPDLVPTPPAPSSSPNLNPSPKSKADPETSVPMSVDPSPVAPPPCAATTANDSEMEADGEVDEDSVVREIDMFFTPAPLDDDTQLYVMQYMLRPSWRPYELNERCEEVRVKPKQSKIEVDLSVDVDSENFDQEVAETLRLQKQTLSSSKAPSITNYAVGIMRGNQIHLNPIQAMVRLLPKMTNGDGEPQKRKQNVQSVEVDDGVDELIKPSARVGKIVSPDSNISADDSEPWISLEYHGMDSAFSARYHQQMAANENKHIDFSMEPSDYVISLCPGMSTDMKKTRRPPRRLLLSLSLEQRLKKWLTEVSEVNRFDALMHLAPTNSVQEVLKVLQVQADLVRGLWVTKSSLLYEGIDVHARDYILFLFTKNHSINLAQLRTFSINSDSIKRIMGPLAHTRTELKDWKFKEPLDLSFIKRYPEIVKEQECAWSTREMYITDSLRRVCRNISLVTKNSLNPNLSKNIAANKVDPDLKKNRDETASTASKVMSAETRKFLPEALSKIFKDQKVRSLNSIIRDLREFAKRLSALPKDSGKSKALVSAVTIGASAPPSELHSVISQVAVYVHGVYVLKPVENDSLRNVFIKLFRDKGPNAKLKKQEITQAATRFLKRVVTESEYNQVVDEICISSEEGCLVLRSGD
ncbi:uncharacterized protein [Typha latifolia]|uniref:uncharacterized protein isoform X1 n=1 Tax=Typha latifolia TaxID=4733 RepID=UPI003C2DA02F